MEETEWKRTLYPRGRVPLCSPEPPPLGGTARHRQLESSACRAISEAIVNGQGGDMHLLLCPAQAFLREAPSWPGSIPQPSHSSSDDLWLESTQRSKLEKQAWGAGKTHTGPAGSGGMPVSCSRAVVIGLGSGPHGPHLPVILHPCPSVQLQGTHFTMDSLPFDCNFQSGD